MCENNEIRETSSVKFKSGFTFSIKYKMTCSSKNLIYLLYCDHCKSEYIGETGTTLRDRFTVHRQQIRDDDLRQMKVCWHIHHCTFLGYRVQMVHFALFGNL